MEAQTEAPEIREETPKMEEERPPFTLTEAAHAIGLSSDGLINWEAAGRPPMF